MGIEGAFLNIIKAIYETSTANITHNGQKLKFFPTKIRNNTRVSAFHLFVCQEKHGRVVIKEPEIFSSCRLHLMLYSCYVPAMHIFPFSIFFSYSVIWFPSLKHYMMSPDSSKLSNRMVFYFLPVISFDTFLNPLLKFGFFGLL